MKKRNKIELHDARMMSDAEMKEIFGGNSSNMIGCSTNYTSAPQCNSFCGYVKPDGYYSGICHPRPHVFDNYYGAVYYSCYCGS